MTKEEAETANCVTGTFPILSENAHVLFDGGASHSFISHEFVKKLGLEPTEVVECSFTVPSGETVPCNVIYKGLTVKILGVDFLADLIGFPLPYFDVILGMDWLGRHKAQIDC